jgi:hypothetical protein
MPFRRQFLQWAASGAAGAALGYGGGRMHASAGAPHPVNGPGGPTTDVRTAGLAGDGSTDDGPALARLIDRAPEGSVLHFPPGEYGVSGEIRIRRTLHLRGEGGARFVLLGNPRPGPTLGMFSIAAPDVSFSGLEFSGEGVIAAAENNRFLWWEAGLDNAGGRVNGCVFMHLPGGGSNFNGAVGFGNGAHDGEVAGSVFDSCPGAVFTQGARTRIISCLARSPRDVSFALNGAGCNGASVIGCKVHAPNVPCSIHIGVEEGAAQYLIAHNHVHGVRDGIGIGCVTVAVPDRSTGGVITGNVVDGGGYVSDRPSALLDVGPHYSDVIVTDNHFLNGSTGHGGNALVKLSAASNTFARNVVRRGRATGFAIYVQPAGGRLVLDCNTVDAGGLARCIWVAEGDNGGHPLQCSGNRFENAVEGITTIAARDIPLFLRDDEFPGVSTPVHGPRWQDFFNANVSWRFPHRVRETVELYGAGIPSGGSWVVGDRVREVVPRAGGSEGAVCVAAGTPGSWRSVGMVK